MPMWSPEHPVDLTLAAELIQGQFPELCTDSLQYLGMGWDNCVFRLDDLVFRFPHRAIGVELIEVERDALAKLAPFIELPIPVPVKIGQPSPPFPYPFLGQRFVVGRALEELKAGTPVNQEALAVVLGGFLRRLHSVSTSLVETWGVPRDSVDGEMERMGTLAAKIVAGVEDLKDDPLVSMALGAILEVPAEAQAEESTLCHGDLHIRHLLFDDVGAMSGVIDWGDLHIGDPAQDLITVYVFLDPRHRAAFWRTYGAVEQGVPP